MSFKTIEYGGNDCKILLDLKIIYTRELILEVSLSVSIK